MILRPLAVLLWAIGWPIAAFFMIGFALMGDPAEGAADLKMIFARCLLLAAVAIYGLGYWLILRKRKH